MCRPARQADLIEGCCRLPAPDGPTTMAVKLLGDEVLVTAEV